MKNLSYLLLICLTVASLKGDEAVQQQEEKIVPELISEQESIEAESDRSIIPLGNLIIRIKELLEPQHVTQELETLYQAIKNKDESVNLDVAKTVLLSFITLFEADKEKYSQELYQQILFDLKFFLKRLDDEEKIFEAEDRLADFDDNDLTDEEVQKLLADGVTRSCKKRKKCCRVKICPGPPGPAGRPGPPGPVGPAGPPGPAGSPCPSPCPTPCAVCPTSCTTAPLAGAVQFTCSGGFTQFGTRFTITQAAPGVYCVRFCTPFCCLPAVTASGMFGNPKVVNISTQGFFIDDSAVCAAGGSAQDIVTFIVVPIT